MENIKELNSFLNEENKVTITYDGDDLSIDDKVLKKLKITQRYKNGVNTLIGLKKDLITYLKNYNAWTRSDIIDTYPALYESLNEAVLSDFVDSPGKTEIWYEKHPKFDEWEERKKYGIALDPKNLKKTHALLGTINETDPDKIFLLLNSWGGAEENKLLKSKGVGHTSMSIGDIIKIGNKVLYVDEEGFKDITKDKINENVDLFKHLKNLDTFVNEANKYQVYHNSYSSAIDAALEYAKSKGYEIDEDDVWDQISIGPAKPIDGITNKASIGLLKNGKPQRKALHIQIYGMGNKYELNAYIN